jgi:hypothetical protein
MVPVQHGQWLAASIPGAQADISDRAGHLTMHGRVGEIHDWLLQRLRLVPAPPPADGTAAEPAAACGEGGTMTATASSAQAYAESLPWSRSISASSSSST